MSVLFWIAVVAAGIVAIPVAFFVLSAIGTLIVGVILIARLPDLDLGEPDPFYETDEQRATRLRTHEALETIRLAA